jgi:hypothetical protein
LYPCNDNDNFAINLENDDMLKTVLFLFASLVAFSCNKNDEIDPLKLKGEYFVFGTSATGMCGGDCTTLYLIKDGKLYSDRVSNTATLAFNETPLGDDKYQIAKQALDSLPAYLIQNTNQTFGCPDCADQGGFYLQLKNNTTISTWQLDMFKQQNPVQIHPYYELLKNIMNQLK